MIHTRHLLINVTKVAALQKLADTGDIDLTVALMYRMPELRLQYPTHMWVDGEPEYEAIVARCRQQLTVDVAAIYGMDSYTNPRMAWGNCPFTRKTIVTAFHDDEDEWGWDDFDPLDCSAVGRCLALELGQDRSQHPWTLVPVETVADGYSRGGVQFIPDITTSNTVTTWTLDATNVEAIRRQFNAAHAVRAPMTRDYGLDVDWDRDNIVEREENPDDPF